MSGVTFQEDEFPTRAGKPFEEGFVAFHVFRGTHVVFPQDRVHEHARDRVGFWRGFRVENPFHASRVVFSGYGKEETR